MSLLHVLLNSPVTFPLTFLLNQTLTILTIAYTPPSSYLRLTTLLFTFLTAILVLWSDVVKAWKPGNGKEDARVRAGAVCQVICFVLSGADLLCWTGVRFEGGKNDGGRAEKGGLVVEKEDEGQENGHSEKKAIGIKEEQKWESIKKDTGKGNRIGMSFEQYLTSSFYSLRDAPRSKEKGRHGQRSTSITSIAEDLDLPHKKNEEGRKDNGVEDTIYQRLKWGASITHNFRRILTPYQISCVPPFSTTNPLHIPSRLSFLVRTALLIFFSVSVTIYLGNTFGLLGTSETSIHFLSRSYTTFLPRLFVNRGNGGEGGALPVSLEELIFRSRQVACFWLVAGGYQFLMYEAFALFSVGLGIQEPGQWPPYFGRARDAWSVRQFWGSSWHQSFRQLLTSNTDFVVFKILRFPRGGLMTRYTRLILSFFISGLIHLAMEAQHGFGEDGAGSINFFLLQPLGIMLEDLVQAMGRICFPKMNNRVKSWIGYTWVVVWLLETSPVWFYSQLELLMRISETRQ